MTVQTDGQEERERRVGVMEGGGREEGGRERGSGQTDREIQR